MKTCEKRIIAEVIPTTHPKRKRMAGISTVKVLYEFEVAN